MASYLVQETDGTSKFTLEDSSGALLLETSTPAGGSSDTAQDFGALLVIFAALALLFLA